MGEDERLERLRTGAMGTATHGHFLKADVRWLVEEVARLRAIEAAARAVLDAHTYPGARWVEGTPMHGLSVALAGA